LCSPDLMQIGCFSPSAEGLINIMADFLCCDA
jgi:hypothetical protein